MNRFKIIFLFILFTSTLSFGQTTNEVKSCDENAIAVSIIQLISTPEKYDGKRIVVKGYLNLIFEETALYISQADEENRIQKNSIWIEIQPNRNSIYHKKYVTLIGTFDMKSNGMWGAFNYSIKNVTKIFN